MQKKSPVLPSLLCLRCDLKSECRGATEQFLSSLNAALHRTTLRAHVQNCTHTESALRQLPVMHKPWGYRAVPSEAGTHADWWKRGGANMNSRANSAMGSVRSYPRTAVSEVLLSPQPQP